MNENEADLAMRHRLARQQQIFKDIQEERDAQDEKWGCIESRLSGEPWPQILMEEVGEVAQADMSPVDYDLRAELVQVAAVAVAWIEALNPRYPK